MTLLSSFPRLEAIAQDVRYALRGLLSSKGFTATAILTLGVGLGLNTVLFTVFNAYALRPLAVRDPHNLFELGWYGKDGGGRAMTWREYQMASSRKDVFAETIADVSSYGIANGNTWIGRLVSGNYFASLGARTQLGRPIVEADAMSPGGEPVMVIGHFAWQRFFSGRTAVLGEKVMYNGQPFEIVGVAVEEFTGLDESPPDFWIPLTMYRAVKQDEDLFGEKQPVKIRLAGRLQPGITPQQASAALTPMVRRFAAEHRTKGDVSASLRSLETTIQMSPMAIAMLSPVFGAFLLVLVAACANVSNMVLARGAARQREIGIRLALGAGRARLVRQLLMESLLLALAAGAVGFAVCTWGIRLVLELFYRTAPPELVDVSRLVPLQPDYRVLAAVLLTAGTAALMLGLLPALQTTRLSLTSAIQGKFGERHSTGKLRGLLVVGQVIVSTVLLIGAVAFTRSSITLQSIDTGLNVRGVAHVEAMNGVTRKAIAEYLAQRGVREVAAVRRPPLFGGLSRIQVTPAGSSSAQVAGYNFVSPEYFTLLGVPILRGRGFTRQESENQAPVVVVSEATASRFWPGHDPIGKSISVQKATARFVDNLPQVTQPIVIGVAKDVTSGWVTEGRDPACLYFPTSLLSQTDSSLLVRAGKSLREELVRQWPALPLQVVPLESVLSLQVYPFRAAAWIGSVLGAIALLLTVSGMYGVMSYLVGQRRREIGIRMALGSTPALVVRLVMNHSIVLTVVGLSVGVAIATALGMLVKAVIPVKGIIASGALDLLLAAATVTAAALLAAFLPSRRAARVDPALALRTD